MSAHRALTRAKAARDALDGEIAALYEHRLPNYCDAQRLLRERGALSRQMAALRARIARQDVLATLANPRFEARP